MRKDRQTIDLNRTPLTSEPVTQLERRMLRHDGNPVQLDFSPQTNAEVAEAMRKHFARR